MANIPSAGDVGAKAAAALKGTVAEFKGFLVKHSVLALAVGVVIGAAGFVEAPACAERGGRGHCGAAKPPRV